MDRKYHLSLLKTDGQEIPGEIYVWDELPSNPDLVKLEIHFDNDAESEVAETFWESLIKIRDRLELRKIRPCIHGACLNVFPSPMALDMGGAELAYKLELGKQAKLEDLVSIFEMEPGITPVSVKEQAEFYQQWIDSLG